MTDNALPAAMTDTSPALRRGQSRSESRGPPALRSRESLSPDHDRGRGRSRSPRGENSSPAPALRARESQSPGHGWEDCRQSVRPGHQFDAADAETRRVLKSRVNVSVRSKHESENGSGPLVPAPAVHAPTAIAHAPTLHALRSHALQDARRLCASPPAD